MVRRSRLLAGLASLVGARRLKLQIDDALVLGKHDTDDFSLSPFNRSAENLEVHTTSHDAKEADGEEYDAGSNESTVDSIVHLVCEGNPSATCPCKYFFYDLINICNKSMDKKLNWFPKSERNCSDLVYKLWNNQPVDDDLVYKLYLAPQLPGSDKNESIPVFWAGFSWTLGTRQTLDEILRNASGKNEGVEIAYNKIKKKRQSLRFRDIEHEDTPIGKALRARNWDRACHASKHDSDLWVSLSKNFARSARQKADLTRQTKKNMENAGAGLGIGAAAVYAAEGAAFFGTLPVSVFGAALAAFGFLTHRAIQAKDKHMEASVLSMVVVVNNYHVDKLERDSFLVEHELENLYGFHNIIIWDFKSHCSPALMQLITSRTTRGQPVISCFSGNEVAVRHGRDQFFSTGKYTNILHHLSYANSSRQNSVLNMMQTANNFMKTAGTIISKLEACQTHGIVWRTPAQPITTLAMIGSTDEDNRKECQRLCGGRRDCSHFNFFIANRSCQLLSRNENLYYEIIDETIGIDVISGRPARKGCAEDADRAPNKEKVHEAKGNEQVPKEGRIVNVTSLVRTHVFETSGYRCCCDKRKTGPSTNRGIHNDTYPDYCLIVHTQKCGGVKIRYGTIKANSYHRKLGRCEILQDDVPALVKILNATDYCPKYDYEFMDMEVEIPAAAIGEIRNVTCKDGSVGHVTCQIGTPSVGDWGPVQCGGRKKKNALGEVRIIDVTSLVRTDVFETSGYRCCCDKRKTGPSRNRGINTGPYPEYCVIAHTRKCGAVKVRYDTEKANSYHKKLGRCEILQDDVPVLVNILNVTDYCPKYDYEFMDMEVDIPAAAIGEIRNVTCKDGSMGNVTCQVGTPSVGYWGPVQCGGKPAWCPAIPKIDDLAPAMAAAQLGDESELLCQPGEPSTDKTKCSEKGWIPESDHAYSEWNIFGFPPVCFQFE